MFDQEKNKVDPDRAGLEMYALISELYPVCRSITGNGVRETLKIISAHIPLRTYEIPTGTKVFDWEVPKEWNIRDAYIKDSKGNKIVDFKRLNLHVLNYSTPVNKHVTLDELKKHVFTIPDQPDLVPYKTSYYNENWGFCMSYNQLLSLKDDTYHVYIDSSLENGSLTYGELLIKGKSTDEVLVSTHICHPSLCNDNLSGIAVATFIAKYLADIKMKHTFRFLFIPGTIGSITWLSINEKTVNKIKHGLVITLLGDDSDFTYKRSREGNAEIDKSVETFLSTSDKPFAVSDFVPYGYDERQYCSPGFNMPVGCFTRKPYGEFPEYHTSADNLDFVRPEKLGESLQALLDMLYIIENNETYINLSPKCEPQLGKRGLYDEIGGTSEGKITQLALLWVLNYSDGFHSLLDIAMKSKIKFGIIKNAADALFKFNLLKKKLKA
jgi:aminopeptidase-like protein